MGSSHDKESWRRPVLAGDRMESGRWVCKLGKEDSSVSCEMRIPPDGHCTWLGGRKLPTPLVSRTLCPGGSVIGLSVRTNRKGSQAHESPVLVRFTHQLSRASQSRWICGGYTVMAG